jgi:hypothetical protein
VRKFSLAVNSSEKKIIIYLKVKVVQNRPKTSDFSGRKNPQHAFLRRGSKSLSHVADFRHVKKTLKVALTRYVQAKYTGNFSPNFFTFHC